MSNIKSESLEWLDELAAITAQLEKTPDATHAELGKTLNIDRGKVTVLLAVKPCLDPAAIAKVRQAAQTNPPYTLSFNSARALAGLGKAKVSDLSGSIHAALDSIFAHSLTTKQIKSLVKWMISGKPASEFDPKAKPPGKGTKEDKTDKGKGEDQTGTNQTLDLKKLGELFKKAEAEKALGKTTTELKKLEKYLRSLFLSSSSSKTSKNTSGSKKGFSETIMLDWLGDIKIIKQIQTKIKKDEPLTKGEVAFLWLHKVGEIVGHLVKLILKLFKPILKILHGIGKLVKEALEVLGLYKYAKAILTLVVVIAALWFAWEAFHYGVIRPVEMIWSKFHHEQMASEPTPVPTPLTGTSQPEVTKLLSFANSTMVHLKPKPTPIPKPVMAYRPSVSFKTTDFDPQLLEQEIAAIPANSVIKDYVFQPDEGMPADLAVSRLQNLTDADKYTMMIGSGKQKILSFTPSNTNFIIAYKSANLFGVFGDGSGQRSFFWEDVRMILVDEIDVQGENPSIIYQCSLIVSGSKNPLTIQCANTEDLENLVSAMEYFIRHSRLAHDAQPAGMPYPAQGLRLIGQNQVENLWAGSPADKAGLKLGDVIWSLDVNAPYLQDRKTLLAGLQSLTPGSHTLYMVNPADLAKAQGDVAFHRASSLNPKRYQVQIIGN